MTEQEEREQIKANIIADIDFLKSNENNIRTALVRIFPNSEDTASVDIALNTIKLNDTAYLDTGTLETLKGFYINIINQFTIIARAFLSDTSNKNAQNKLIESAKNFNDIANSISIQNVQKGNSVKIGGSGVIIGGVDLGQQINAVSDQIERLEKSITHLQSSDTQIEITKILTQAQKLFDKASSSEKVLDEKIQTLINTSEKQVAYTLSEQFSVKCENLKKEVSNNLKSLTIALSLFLFWNAFLFFGFYTKLFVIEYWQFIIFKITLNIPFAFFIVITFNEYTKAKKLFEEYEHKRIMAATLVNNLERLKNELHADEKDLLELIKVPFERIFDNPVHSIYGDKSGDKNIGLDQLEKITSIIEKMKK